jgi:hypothetical protein
MILILLLFLAFSFVLAVKKPTYFVVLYLLVTTRFLGFLNLDIITFNGYEISFVLLNFIAFIGTFTTKTFLKISKKFFLFQLLIVVLILFGIFYPYYMGFSEIFKSVISGKDFYYYFLLFYLVGRRNSLDIALILKSVKFLGLYLSVVLIIYLLIGVAPLYYEEKLFAIKSLEVYYLTYISLASFIIYYEWISKEIKSSLFLFYMLTLLIGLIIGQHFSIVISTIMGWLLLYILGKKNNFKTLLVKVTIIASLIFVFLIIFTDLRIKIFNTAEGIISRTDVALVSRDRVNEFRWEAIKKQPVFGYGFIHSSSSIMSTIDANSNSKYTSELGLIDSGYVDLLIRFGYFGTISMLIIFGYFLIKIFIDMPKYTKLQVVMATYLLQYYMINFTWSVFSYAHGIVPASVALWIILSKNKDRR